jgi:ABC-type phosphate transport system substrate-binding protein
MFTRRHAAATALIGLTTAGSLVLALAPAEADLGPQPKDVVSVGSDIQQNAFNFLADGYHELPGYNTAGNKWRFVNFDSSGDANGRSAYVSGTSTVANPTIVLRAGADNVTRPSGGNGGLNNLTRDVPGWIDVARSPNNPTTDQQTAAESNIHTRLRTVRVALDRDLIATATVTNAPATLSGDDVLKIYEGTYKKWGDIPGYAGSAPTEDIVPLYLPSTAGMLSVFTKELTRLKGANFAPAAGLRVVQQNDPTVITSLTEAERKNAIVPFPRGRFRLLEKGYYADSPNGGINAYSSTQDRTALSAAGIKLLDPDSSGVKTLGQPFGTDFAYNAVFRESDYQSDEPWQPGSTLNWVQALFYNPGGPEPFVNTEAGKALLRAAGVEPAYDPSRGTQ